MDFSREDLELIRKVLNGTENEKAWKLAMRITKELKKKRKTSRRRKLSGVSPFCLLYDECVRVYGECERSQKSESSSQGLNIRLKD